MRQSVLEVSHWLADSLVRHVEQEDECNDSVGSSVGSVEGELGGADGLQDEEDKHANRRSHEKDSTTDAIDERRGEECPSQVPDLEYTVDEELIES